MKRALLLPAILFLFACQPAAQANTPDLSVTANTSSTATVTPIVSPTVEINIPSGVNPLTGLPVADPALLKIPALLVSISHFPATGRPQAGLSFAPFVYEFYITEGATRFLSVLYGEFPEPKSLPTGNCEVRWGAFVQTGSILGNQVWLDEDANGVQDIWEGGVGGVCVNLFDINGNLLQQTTTDTNGYYGFNVQPGKYIVEFTRPAGMELTVQNIGDDSLDSDADQVTGRVEADVQADVLSLDAGLLPSPNADPYAYLPLAQVGPIRSGRLIYGYLASSFQNSCLIYAFASEEVLARIPQCHMVFHQLAGGGYMLDIPEMRKVARENKRAAGTDFDYTSNLYENEPPAGGVPASQIGVYIAYQNQSGWMYDPLYQSYLRFVDTSEYDKAGILYPDTDRLTRRQLHFENIIVLFANHEVVSPTNLDIRLDQGKSGNARLFRDGQTYKIKWSMEDEEYEERTGQRRPMLFLNPDGSPAALKPGHTWVLVVTPETELTEISRGIWKVLFNPPMGAK